MSGLNGGGDVVVDIGWTSHIADAPRHIDAVCRHFGGPIQRSRWLIHTIALAAIASGACASASHREPVAQAGAQLTRVEELPPAAHGTFAGACASRLRDAASGREYLIVHSVVRTETANSASTQTTNLQSALGDYALIGASDQAGPPFARLRVDCTTSRVVAELGRD